MPAREPGWAEDGRIGIRVSCIVEYKSGLDGGDPKKTVGGLEVKGGIFGLGRDDY